MVSCQNGVHAHNVHNNSGLMVFATKQSLTTSQKAAGNNDWCCEAAYYMRQKPLAHRLEDHQAVVGAAIRTNDNVAATTRSGSLGKKQQGGSTCLWFFRSLQLKLKHVVEIVV